jgi:hypothetical protein
MRFWRLPGPPAAAVTESTHGASRIRGLVPSPKSNHDRTFLVRIREPYAPRVGLMVMIDLVDEKKSLGFSSVTQVTEAWLARYLRYTPVGRNTRSRGLRALHFPGWVRSPDIPRTERKYAEPAETGRWAY